MAVSKRVADLSPEAFGATPANVPGTPIFNTNKQFYISSSNDVLVLTTSGDGGTASIDVDDGTYTGATLATELASKMNADNTLSNTQAITLGCAYDTTTHIFTVTTDTGTIAFTLSGSDAASTFGFTADVTAAASILSDSEAEGQGTITFDFDDNDNSALVEYAVYDNTTAGYIDTDGIAAAETWDTYANWSNGGASGRVTANGLTDYTTYTFKVKAKNEIGTETAFSANSAAMNTFPLLDWGSPSTNLERLITTGNTLIWQNALTSAGVISVTDSLADGSLTFYVPAAVQSGAVPIEFVLRNMTDTPGRVVFQYSEASATTGFANCTDFFTIGAANNKIRFTSGGGSESITLDSASYDDGDAMATELQSKMNAGSVITLGGITFTVTWSSTTEKYTITPSTGNLTILFYHVDTTGAYTYGFTDAPTAATSIASDEVRGESPRVLSTDEDGVAHTFYWDSYTDAGESEKKTSSVWVRATPYDVSPSGGDAGEQRTIATAFSLNNRPAVVTLVNSDGFTFDEDTTPIFQGVMASIRGGTYLFFRIRATDGGDVSVIDKTSASEIAGWMYETSTGVWVAVTATGVDIQYADGVNRIKYTVQSALTPDNDNEFTITLEQGEARDR